MTGVVPLLLCRALEQRYLYCYGHIARCLLKYQYVKEQVGFALRSGVDTTLLAVLNHWRLRDYFIKKVELSLYGPGQAPRCPGG